MDGQDAVWADASVTRRVPDTAPAAPAARAPGRWSVATAVAVVWIALMAVMATLTAALHQRAGHLGDAGAALLFLVIPVVGALVAIAEPRQPIGWIYLVVGSVTLLGSAEAAVLTLRYGSPADWPAWSGDVEAALWPLTFPLMCLSLLWFPDGRLPSPRWRAVVAAQVLVIAFLVVVAAPGARVSAPLFGLVPPAATVLSFLCVASLPRRYLRGDVATRERMRWILLPVVGTAAAVLAIAVTGALGSTPVWLLGLAPAPVILGVPITVGVALLRFRVFDIDLVLVRATVGLALGFLLSAAYVAVLRVVDAADAGPAWLPSTTAAAAAVLLVGPASRRGRRVADRWLYGDRGDPLRVLATVSAASERGGIADATGDANTDLVTAIAHSLRLRFVALDLPAPGAAEPTRVASVGSADGLPLVEVPIPGGADGLGRLVVAERSPRTPLAPDERALLAAVAGQVGARLASEQLRGEVERSRTRIVQAGAADRRRLRRDLHDDLGARLTAIGYTIEAASRAAQRAAAAGASDAVGAVEGEAGHSSQPSAELRAALDRAKAETMTTVAELRRIIAGLRPGALDDLGLAAALVAGARTVLDGAGVALETAVPAPPADAAALAGLDAATETALFLIGTEAVTNVARHAHATHASVTLRLDPDAVVLVVEDDGIGWDAGAGRAGGLGIASMRRRASELGGSVDLAPRAGGGTRVTATVPRREATRDDRAIPG